MRLPGTEKALTIPVLVSLWPDGDTQAIGFMTRENLEALGIEDQVAVYFPQSFNFAGNLLIVPSRQVHAAPGRSERRHEPGGIGRHLFSQTERPGETALKPDVVRNLTGMTDIMTIRWHIEVNKKPRFARTAESGFLLLFH